MATKARACLPGARQGVGPDCARGWVGIGFGGGERNGKTLQVELTDFDYGMSREAGASVLLVRGMTTSGHVERRLRCAWFTNDRQRRTAHCRHWPALAG